MITPADYPLYRLLGGPGRYVIDVWVSDVAPGTNPDDPYGEPECKTIADVLSLDSAMAVLRLCGATRYHDRTQRGASWDTPITEITA